MRPRIYLAGPITGLSYDGAVDWRAYAKDWLDQEKINGFSPLRAKTYLSGETAIDGSPEAYAKVHPLSAPKGICARDRWDVQKADAVLMNLLGATRVSIGSMIEIGWADAYRVPLVLVMEPDTTLEARGDLLGITPPRQNLHHHAMVDQLAGYIVPTLEDGLKMVRALVLP